MKSFHDFSIPGDFPDKQRLRFNHFEVCTGTVALATFSNSTVAERSWIL